MPSQLNFNNSSLTATELEQYIKIQAPTTLAYSGNTIKNWTITFNGIYVGTFNVSGFILTPSNIKPTFSYSIPTLYTDFIYGNSKEQLVSNNETIEVNNDYSFNYSFNLNTNNPNTNINEMNLSLEFFVNGVLNNQMSNSFSYNSISNSQTQYTATNSFYMNDLLSQTQNNVNISLVLIWNPSYNETVELNTLNFVVNYSNANPDPYSTNTNPSSSTNSSSSNSQTTAFSYPKIINNKVVKI